MESDEDRKAKKKATKVHPRSLLQLLKFLRKQIHGLNQKRLAERLALVPSGYGLNACKRAMISRWELGDSKLEYPHLERYAHSVKMPIGILLIMSRISADIVATKRRNSVTADPLPTEETELSDLRQMMHGLARLVVHYGVIESEMLSSSTSDKTSEEHLLRLFEAYQGKPVHEMRKEFEQGYMPARKPAPDLETAMMMEGLKEKGAENSFEQQEQLDLL